jgi:hypothetical protein
MDNRKLRIADIMGLLAIGQATWKFLILENLFTNLLAIWF